MTRRLTLLLFLLAFAGLTACAGPEKEPISTNTFPASPQPTSIPETAVQSTAVPMNTVEPAPTQVPTSVPTVTETSTPIPIDLSITPDGISVYPVPKLYEGDLVSFRIAPTIPPGMGSNDIRTQILVDNREIVHDILNWRSLGGDTYGMYEWVWNTAGQVGEHVVTVIMDPEDRVQVGDENPDNNQATLILVVNPRTELPPLSANPSWVTASNNCCILHVVSGTAAHRDLSQLLTTVDTAFLQASARLNESFDRRYDVFFIDRVLGQGGYATGSMVVSYLDRNYTGLGLNEVLVHEAVHLIDRSIAPNRITFLAEGVAVWAAGGHYRQEDLGRRTAALIELGVYIPLAELIDNFYPTQHEISYLEAGSLISYLVETYGWEQVRNFYSDTTVFDASPLSASVDLNFQLYFDRSLAEIEADWLAYLQGLPRDPREAEDLRTTIRYYNVMRGYQERFDPSAYYLSAWLPSPSEAERQGTTAEFSRHPETATHIALEALMLSAHSALQAGDYARANALLDSVTRVLDNGGTFLDPLAGTYLDIVRTTASMDYQIQRITLEGTQATVFVTGPDNQGLRQLNLVLQNSTWILTQ